MATRFTGSVRRGLPMFALFLGAFGVTLVLQQKGVRNYPALLEPPQAVAAIRFDAVAASVDAPHPEENQAMSSELEERPPTLKDLAIEGDPDTQAEARALLSLLDSEPLPEG